MSRRWRRWAGAVLVLAVLALDALVVGTYLLDRRGLEAWDEGRYARAERTFSLVDRADVVERWIAPYDAGTAALAGGDAGRAVDRLEIALDHTPPAQVCRVALNLALAHEALGDPTSAREVLLERDCDDQQSLSGRQVATDGRSLARNARAVIRRLEAAIADEDPAEPDPESDEEQSTEDELQRRNDRAERAREEQLREMQQDAERREARQRDRDQVPQYAW